MGDASMADTKLVVTYGGLDSRRYEAQSCVAVSHSEIQCASAHGRGWNHSVQVTVAGVTGPPSIVKLRYATPTISGIAGHGAKLAMTKGGQLLEISGNNFGPVGSLKGYVIYGHAEEVNQTTHDPCDRMRCSGHGACMQSKCACFDGWTGESCEACFSDEDKDLICDERRGIVFRGHVADTVGGSKRKDLIFEAVDCRVTAAN